MCLFVLISRKDIILGALLREVSLLYGVHCFSQVSWRPIVKHTHTALLNKSFHASEHANS